MPTELRFEELDLREEPASAAETIPSKNTIVNTCSHPSVNPCTDFCCPGLF